MPSKLRLIGDFVAVIGSLILREIGLALKALVIRFQSRIHGSKPATERHRTIVVVGASFAGHHAAKVIATLLPYNSDYRVVVIEPNSHFQFTWVLPRFCVAKGHEHKAFVPYGKYISAPKGAISWIKARVQSITHDTVKLEGSNEDISYDYLVIATGAGVAHGLPSRVNCTDKAEGILALQQMQNNIEAAKSLVVVGGGAAGVEVATDAKSKYADKRVTLVHSRDAVMHRFGKRLQDIAQEGLDQLGVDVILNDRVISENTEGTIKLKSGRTLDCDFLVNCTGQKPNSSILESIAPNAVSADGIKVLPTLQIQDPSLPNIYAIGDVAATGTPQPNGRSAREQGTIAGMNVIAAVCGKKPAKLYKPHWMEGFIKLTLSLDRSVTFFGDGDSSFLFKSKEKKEELMASDVWRIFGQKPYLDTENVLLNN